MEVFQDRRQHHDSAFVVVGNHYTPGAVVRGRFDRRLRTLDESEDAKCPEQEILCLIRSQDELAMHVGDGREISHQVFEEADDNRGLAAAREHFDRRWLLADSRNGSVDKTRVEGRKAVEPGNSDSGGDHMPDATDGSQRLDDRIGFGRLEPHHGEPSTCQRVMNDLVHEGMQSSSPQKRAAMDRRGACSAPRVYTQRPCRLRRPAKGSNSDKGMRDCAVAIA
jgi:hypothetical protein